MGDATIIIVIVMKSLGFSQYFVAYHCIKTEAGRC